MQADAHVKTCRPPLKHSQPEHQPTRAQHIAGHRQSWSTDLGKSEDDATQLGRVAGTWRRGLSTGVGGKRLQKRPDYYPKATPLLHRLRTICLHQQLQNK
jgi:hypothetical protein